MRKGSIPVMKSALLAVVALALFASAAAAQDQRTTTQTDSVAIDDGSAQRTGDARPCTSQEWVTASFACDDKHAPLWTSCRLTACVVRGGWIVYWWNGYYANGA